jgi:hypothetical protein
MGCCWRGDGSSEREERKYEVTEVAVARCAVSTSCCILQHTGNGTYSSRVLWVNVINDQGARRSQRRFSMHEDEMDVKGRSGRKSRDPNLTPRSHGFKYCKFVSPPTIDHQWQRKTNNAATVN